MAVPRQQPSSDVMDNLFLCRYPSEGGVCIIPMALDGRNLIYRVKPHEIQNLNLVPPLLVCIPLYSFFFFPLCYIIELLPLVPSLNSYSRPPLPTETAFLKVSDVFSDLVRQVGRKGFVPISVSKNPILQEKKLSSVYRSPRSNTSDFW